MSQAPLTPEQAARFNDTRQPALWASLSVFLLISNVTIVGRLWATWRGTSRQMPVMAEGIFIVMSGVLLNVIIGNLMAATRYGLGLHFWTVNALDENYPHNLSKAFMHIWITMVLMSSFFTCIKLTLLFFYKRLFLVTDTKIRIFWWANLVYVILWFFGGTGFYLFQCKPVQWYFLQYYARFGKPVPGNLTGQCDATTVVHVALPMIFSLISDIGLMALPLWAIWGLRLSRWKKIGLLAVFGIGFAACLLELARILALLIDTDDKTDPSYGVANFLIFTGAEETAAIVCACLPVIGPQLYKLFKHQDKGAGASYKYGSNASARLRTWHTTPDGFHRFDSEHHIGMTTVVPAEDPSGAPGHDSDMVPLQTIVFAEKADSHTHALRDSERQDLGRQGTDGVGHPRPPPPPGIHVRTDVQVVHSDMPMPGSNNQTTYLPG